MVDEQNTSHAGHGSALARLVYAYRASDGAYVSINEVPSGLDRDLLCPSPICRTPLIARKGPRKRTPHFAHYGFNGRDCASARETSAHLLAKDILAETRWLMLPAVVARLGDAVVVVSPARRLTFDTAEIEQRVDDLIPDVLLRIGDKTLLVEVRVTHPCGPEKIAKLREAKRATVEIDIRKAQHGDRAAIAVSILETGDREWLYNDKKEAVLADLRRKAKAAERAAAAELDERAARRVAIMPVIASRTEGAAAISRIGDLGQHRLLLPETGVDRVFQVPTEEWKALVAARCLIQDYSDHWDGSFGLASALAWVKSIKLIDPRLSDRMDDAMLRAVRRLVPDYLTGGMSLRVYFNALVEAGCLSAEEPDRWRQTPEFRRTMTGVIALERRTRERLERLERRVREIVQRLPDFEREAFDYHVWRSLTVVELAASPEALTREDDVPAWEQMMAALGSINRALQWGADETAGVTFNLPVAAAIRSATAARQESERIARDDRIRAEAEAAQARLEAVRSAASGEMTPAHIKAWFDRVVDGSNETIAELIRSGPEGQASAMRGLESYRLRRERQARDTDIADGVRETLREKAIAAMGEQMAGLWLYSANDKLGGERPWDYAGDLKRQARCVALLPRRRA